MLTGQIIDNRPVIQVVVGWKLNVQDLLALVDTGFTGELKVSPNIAQELGLETTDVRTVSLGDGKPTVWGSGLATVSMEGVQKEVSVLIGDGPTIIGVSLLRNFGYTLTMDFQSDTFFLQKKSDGVFDVDE